MPALPNAERLPTLDILRGFALMGILIMNMPGFSYSDFTEADGSFHWPGQVDQLSGQVRDALFSGKFNSMFSLLFGIGFTIQFTRMQQQDPLHATGLYVRRLLVLLVIGLLHATLFWTGNVLHVYAVLGLLAGRRRWVQRIPELMPQICRLMGWALAAGLVCGAASSAIFALNRAPGPIPIKLLGSLCHHINRPAMMIFYVLLIVRLAQLPLWQRRLLPFAAAGRMPLTNYLCRR